MIAHENYNSITIENDVGLIRVATPFVWDENTAPVSLPVQGQVTNGGENASVIGWGTPRVNPIISILLQSGGSVMQFLQEVDYWTVSDQECMDAHSYDVFETNICAYYPGGGKGQCNGDSGGPLWVKGQQVGIVSWSVKPCTVAPLIARIKAAPVTNETHTSKSATHQKRPNIMFTNVKLLILALAGTNLVLATQRYSHSFFSNRLANGTDVPPGKYPSVVSLRFGIRHYCGGTILNEQWILTAAHCLYGYKPEYFKVNAGTVDRLDGGQSFDVEEVICHENYDIMTMENDVGLIKVKTPFKWSASIRPASLSKENQNIPAGTSIKTLGWGIPFTGGSTQRVLQEAEFLFMTNEECKNAHLRTVFPTNICAYASGGEIDQSIGDSGGPLWLNDQQVGIVSWWQYPRSSTPYGGVFTKVASYVDWINSHIGARMHRSCIALIYTVALTATVSGFPKLIGRSFGGERIVNGTAVPEGKYPAMTSSGFDMGREIRKLILANFDISYQPSYFKVYAGSVNLTHGGQSYDVTQLIWHENYNRLTIENDVGLLKVSKPFVWDENVAPVSLPNQDQFTPTGSNATVIGWGIPYTGGNTMEILQEVNYWIVNYEMCASVHDYPIFTTNICAYYPGGGKGQCSGDSGGPLWVDKQQVGIVSWSEKPCTIAPYPGVFTKVSSYIDWINIHID
ncbi:hypothetical protein B566_EDAN002701 [Ephemera danica]|nr:hypothetical protein B566_EDAN002701 [Ephemera danica]